MDNKKVDLTLKVNAEVDSASFAAARSAAADIAPEPQGGQGAAGALPGDGRGAEQASAEAAAERQLAAARQAAERSAADEAAQIEALKAQMALEAKGRAGLIAELERLQKARVAAAKAGDVEAFATLTRQMEEARKAYEAMNQGLEISRLNMLGQLNVALQAGSAMQALGNECQNGVPSLMGIANAMLAVGAAVKAGMGPIGWVMLAIQGLSMAWDWYSSKQEEAARAERERAATELEMAERHLDAMGRLSSLERGNLLAQWTDALRTARAGQEEMARALMQRIQESDLRASYAEQRRIAAAQEEYNREQARVELLKVSGQLTDREAAVRMQSAREVLEAERNAVRLAEALRNAQGAHQIRVKAEADVEDMERQIQDSYGKFEEVLRVKMPTPDEWDALQLRLREGVSDLQDRELGNAVHAKIDEVRSLLSAMGVGWQGTDEELVRYIDTLRQGREAAEDRLNALKSAAESARLDWLQAQANSEGIKADAQQQEKTRALLQQQQAAQLAAAERSREWQEVQRGSLEEQALKARRDALEALRRSPDVDAETLRQINARLEETQEQLRGVRDAMRDNATAARRWLRELEPPRVQAAKSSYEAAMKRHAQAYTRAAKRAEKAAEAGNAKELARAQQSMGRYARAMERLAKKPAQVEAMHSETLRKTNEALRSADDGRQADRDAARAKERTAKAAQREAREAERSARETRRRDGQGVPADSGQQVGQLTGQLQQMQAQAAAMQAALQQVASAVDSLAAAAGQAVAAAQQLAAATSAKVSQLNAKIASLQTAINNLRSR